MVEAIPSDVGQAAAVAHAAKPAIDHNHTGEPVRGRLGMKEVSHPGDVGCHGTEVVIGTEAGGIVTFAGGG